MARIDSSGELPLAARRRLFEKLSEQIESEHQADRFKSEVGLLCAVA